MDDVELFEYLSEVIRREQLFLNPLLDRLLQMFVNTQPIQAPSKEFL